MNKTYIFLILFFVLLSFALAQENFITYEGTINYFDSQKGEIEISIKENKRVPIDFEYNMFDRNNNILAKILIYAFSDNIAKAKIISYYSININTDLTVELRVEKEIIDKEFNKLISTADKYFEKNEFKEAIPFYLQALSIKRDKQSLKDKIAKAYLNLSQNELEKANFIGASHYIEKSISYCDKESELFPEINDKKNEIQTARTSFQSQFEKAEKHLSENNLEIAEKKFKDLSKKYPANKKISQKIAQTENLIKKKNALKKNLQSILEESNKRLNNDNHYSAIEFLQEKLIQYPLLKKEISQKIKEIYMDGGDIQFNRGNYANALNYYNKALTYSPEDKEIQTKKNKVKSAILSKNIAKAKSQYESGQYNKAKQLAQNILKYYPGNKKCLDLIVECDYHIFMIEADIAFKSKDYENALIYYEKAYDVINRDEALKGQSKVYYKLSQEALDVNDFINYEKYINHYLQLNKQNPSELQNAKIELKIKINKLKDQNSVYYSEAIECAERLFPKDTAFFTVQTSKPELEQKKLKPLIRKYPSRQKKDQEKPKQDKKQQIKQEDQKKFITKNYVFLALNFTNPPDPMGVYSPTGQYTLIDNDSQTVLGVGAGLGFQFSRYSILELSVHYHTKTYEYNYDNWTSYYGWYTDSGEIDNSFTNIDASIYLGSKNIYFGGGGSYAFMSPSQTNISAVANYEELKGFGYHYGGGITIIKNTITLDFKQYNFLFDLPDGEKENFGFFVFGIRINSVF